MTKMLSNGKETGKGKKGGHRKTDKIMISIGYKCNQRSRKDTGK